MKILYVGNFETKHSRLGWCPNGEYIAYALRKAGHEVTCLDEKETRPKELIAECKRYELLLTEEARLKGDSAEVIVKVDIPIVAWLTNIFFTIPMREKELRENPIFQADIVFSTDGGHQEEFEKLGINHVCLRQGIHKPEAKLGTDNWGTKAKIGFVGIVYDDFWNYRKKLLRFLRRTYKRDFFHFGQRGNIRHMELNNLIASLDIVVGDSVYSPNYWSNRLYEMLGRGAFMIFPNIPGIEKEFTPYKHFIPYEYGDFKTLKKIIDHYLNHPKERETIKLAALAHCRKYHTYEHRVEDMFRILREKEIV